MELTLTGMVPIRYCDDGSYSDNANALRMTVSYTIVYSCMDSYIVLSAIACIYRHLHGFSSHCG